MRLKRRPTAALSMAAALFCLVMLFSFSSGAQSQRWRVSWKQIDISAIVPSSIFLFSLQMSDSSTAWLLGYERSRATDTYGGHVYKLKWQSGSWVLSEHYSFPYVVTLVKPVSENSIWAVAKRDSRSSCCNGYDQILHKDASGWHVQAGQLGDVSLGSISMLPGEQEGWAA